MMPRDHLGIGPTQFARPDFKASTVDGTLDETCLLIHKPTGNEIERDMQASAIIYVTLSARALTTDKYFHTVKTAIHIFEYLCIPTDNVGNSAKSLAHISDLDTSHFAKNFPMCG